MISAWRKWNRIFHRDIGYVAFGLTVVYAVSGFAVNHINDWNPNYSKEIKISHIPEEKLPDSNLPDSVLANFFLSYVHEESTYKSSYRPSINEIQFFTDENTITVNFNTREIQEEKVSERFLLYVFNFLHLNKAKKIWTIIADFYAVSLLVLAVTGLFMIKGKNGITGRGAWLTLIGILIPLIFAIVIVE